MDFPYRGAQNAFLPSANGQACERRGFMGLAMGPMQLLLILGIVAMIFGTKKLKDVGGDLGSAIKSFRKAMNTGETEEEEQPPKRLSHDEEQKK
jgi:sec-independent protein translocase protein TatA